MIHSYTHAHPVGIFVVITWSFSALILFYVWFRRRQRLAGTLPITPRNPDVLDYAVIYSGAFYMLTGPYLIGIMLGWM